MHRRSGLLLLLVAGCSSFTLVPEDPPAQQVAANPFSEPRRVMPMRVELPPAPFDVVERVEKVRSQLVGENLEKTGLRPNVLTLAAANPEVFHVSQSQIYITEGMVRQCQTDGQLAAVLANQMGRMIAERESSVSDQARNPERLPPITPAVRINGAGIESDPFYQVEMARYEKLYPRQAKKLSAPNPQAIARTMLERAGFARTELDAAAPLLEIAGRSTPLEDQFRGTLKQSDWQPR